MFIGHFALGFAAKRAAPRVSLGTAFFAAQWLDLLWPTLLLAGVETVRLAPAGAPVPFVFEHYPVSHSLLAAVLWGALVGGVHFVWRRNAVGAMVLAALVVSHWVLDLLVHVPDLPLLPGDPLRAGFGLWRHQPLAFLLELALFAWGVLVYARCTRPRTAAGRYGFVALVAFLLLVQVLNVLGPPPPDVRPVAWVGQAQWLLVLWGWWVDAQRFAVPVAPVAAAAVARTGAR